jgi:cytidine deaminase
MDRTERRLTMEFSELIKQAEKVLGHRELSGSAEAGSVAAAILGANGKVYVGVCIDTACSLGFCAEHSAAAAMVTDGESRILKVAAVGEGGAVMPPCGRCREFLTQLHPENREALALVAPDTAVTLGELLPFDWKAGRNK